MGVDYSCLLCGWSLGGNQDSDEYRMVPPFFISIMKKSYYLSLFSCSLVIFFISCVDLRQKTTSKAVETNDEITIDTLSIEPLKAMWDFHFQKDEMTDVLIQITKGQIDGREYYGTDYITARFDEGTPKKYFFDESSDGSSEVVFLRNKTDFITRCKQAKDIKIDIPIYQAGRPVFSFHVDEPLKWREE